MTENNEELNFYYEKGSFRKRESQTVSDMATGKTGPAKGLFKVLFATKGNKLMFVTMIVCIIITGITGLLMGDGSEDTAGGLDTKLSAFSFEEKVYVSLELKEGKNFQKDIPVVIEALFEAENTDGMIADRAEVLQNFNSEDPQPIHAVFTDYDLKKIFCTVKVNEESIRIFKSIEKR